MPNYAVAASADDYTEGYNANTNSVVLSAFDDTLSDPYQRGDGVANINTSAIGTDTISAATLNFYTVSHTRINKLAPWNRYVTIGGTAVWSSTVQGSAGWTSVTLTPGQLALINKTGITQIKFFTHVGGIETYTESWTIQSWDYSDHSRACYLAVTHAPAGGPTTFSILR